MPLPVQCQTTKNMIQVAMARAVSEVAIRAHSIIIRFISRFIRFIIRFTSRYVTFKAKGKKHALTLLAIGEMHTTVNARGKLFTGLREKQGR